MAAGRHYSTYAVRQSTHAGMKDIVRTNRMRCRQYAHKRESEQRGNIWGTQVNIVRLMRPGRQNRR